VEIGDIRECNHTMPTAPFQIVLAEDNPADVHLAGDALRQHEVDCRLSVMSDGGEVLSFFQGLDNNLKAPCPDLLLLDMHLPKRDGGEILTLLRSSRRCSDTKVIVMTSSEAPSDIDAAAKSAALHYFRKPSSLGQFLQLGKIVRDVLEPLKMDTLAQ